MIFGLFSKGINSASSANRATQPLKSKPVDQPTPPLQPEEKNGNLSILQHQLNAAMKCPAGKNQVYIRSLVTLKGTTPPRIALKCSLRRDAGLSAEVFLEEVRSVCCGEPNQCPAYQQFKQRICPT